MTISHQNRTIEVEQIKSARLSGGHVIYLFRDLKPIGRFSGSYIVGVKLFKQTLHFVRFLTLVSAINAYLDYICRYA